MGFWSALGQGLEQYGENRLKHGHQRGGLLRSIGNAMQDPNPYNPQMANNPNLATMPSDVATAPATPQPAHPPPETPQSGPMASMQAGPLASEGMASQPNSALPIGAGDEAGQQDTPDLSMGSDAGDAGIDIMGSGKIVTQPTLAEVGDKGPEAVVPLTDQPGAKITPGSLGASPRTRWGHPMGPVASKRAAPIRSLLPVKPNAPFR
jgi:hypothetical protein